MRKEILRPAFSGHEMYVAATNGGTITDVAKTGNKRLFIDARFKNFGLNKKTRPTKYAPLAVYELVDKGTFRQMFDEAYVLQPPLLKQSQIIRWLKDNSELFNSSAVIFFFFKKEKSWPNKIIEFFWPYLAEVFVARVNLMPEITYIFPATLEDRNVWSSERHPHYVVAPKF